MAAQSNITLNTIVYTPAGVIGGIAKWLNRALSAAFPRALTQSVNGPNQAGNHRVVGKLSLPVVQEADSSCGCAGTLVATAIANIDVLIPSKLSAAQRLDLRLQIQGYVASTVFAKAIDDLESAW